MNDPVIIVYPTIMDGPVVRWYLNEAAAEYGSDVLSASRSGVMVNGYLTAIPTEWVDAARSAYEAMSGDRRVDMYALATHRKSLRNEIKPVSA